ncbi:MAG: transporter substrate-binding domain-containing protein [Eubacteriales bacterium]|nr:transporter substrate-binding domain-containing protein [Eubacteriales bacterium]
MKKRLAILLSGVMVMSFALAGCGGGGNTPEKTTEASKEDMVYAVEAGSAGAEVAAEKGFKTNEVASQADALMEVQSGTSDAAIIDLLMAGAMIGEGTSYPDLIHTDELTTEEYGVGCRKGSDLASFINSVLYTTSQDGTLQEVAEKYGVQESLVDIPESTFEASAKDSDVAAIKEKGVLVVGVTDFAPMDYKDESGAWIGFDADMANIVAEELGVDCQIVEIDWDTKTMELDSKNIDVVWNGMTLTNEVTNAMECSVPYCNNAQVVVTQK